jgi:hypothetical protein
MEDFMDPNSAIARIIAQMQGAADRSNPALQRPRVDPYMQDPTSGPLENTPGVPTLHPFKGEERMLDQREALVDPTSPDDFIFNLLARHGSMK